MKVLIALAIFLEIASAGLVTPYGYNYYPYKNDDDCLRDYEISNELVMHHQLWTYSLACTSSLLSSNKEYVFVVQSDGNLVVYHVSTALTIQVR